MKIRGVSKEEGVIFTIACFIGVSLIVLGIIIWIVRHQDGFVDCKPGFVPSGVDINGSYGPCSEGLKLYFTEGDIECTDDGVSTICRDGQGKVIGCVVYSPVQCK